MAFNDTYRESIQTKHIANVGFTSTAKGVTNEAFALKNPHQVIASQIPAVDVVGVHGPLVASGIAAGLVEKHTVQLTADPTVNGNKAWIAYETGCTETGHAARGAIRLDQWMRYAETQYKLRLYEDNGSGAPDYTKEILPSEANFNWEYDASAGVVYFDADPDTAKAVPLWGELYTYVGQTVQDGLGATSSGVDDVVAMLAEHHEPDSTDHDDRYYTETETDTLLTTLSGNLQNQITAQDEFIELSDTISEYNEGRILFESSSAVVDSSVFAFRVAEQTLDVPNMIASGNVTVSGTFGFDQTTTVNEITTTVDASSTDSQLPTAQAVYTQINTVSGTLQSSISQNTSDISDLDTELTTASGYLQGQIDDNTSDISDLDTELTTASGYLQTQITNNYNTLDGKIDTASGTLQDAIDDLDDNLTEAIIWEVVDTPFEQIRPKIEHQGKAIYTYGSLTIGGDLTVSGTTTTVNSTELTVADKIITVNAGEAGAGITGERYAGIEVDRGTEENYLFVYDETENNFRVGISGSLQAVATREDAPTDQYVAYWNASEYRFDTATGISVGDIASETFVTSAINTVSGVLQDQIDDVVSDLSTNYYTITQLDAGQLDNRYYTETETNVLLTTLSGTLQSDIDQNASDISDLDAELTTASGHLQDQIDALDDVYATDAELAAVSGTLQTTITNNYNYFDSKIDTASGTLQSQISQNASDITNNYNTLSNVISTASGTLQTQITNNYNTLDDKIDTTSGTLQAAINELGEARDEFIELTDTISEYNAGRILFESSNAVVDDADLFFGENTFFAPNIYTGGDVSISGSLAFVDDDEVYVNSFVTSIDAASTDGQVPTAKAVYDFTSTAITTVSGVLQGELDTLSGTVTTNYNTLNTKIDTTSGTLQTLITENYNYFDEKIDTTSGTLQTTITNNYNTLDGKIDTTSGTLQNEIDLLDEKVDTTSGTLQSIITNNYNYFDSKIDTTSGTLQTSITNNYNTLDGKIDTTSGTLQDAIDDLDGELTDAIIWEVVDTPFDQIRPKVEHQGKAVYTYGDLTIGGNLTVSGTTTTVHSEELTVTDKIITVNAGEVGAGITGGRYAGIEIDRGSEENYFFVYDEVENNFRVGISGTLQAVATREDTPTDQYIAYWNAAEYRFDTVSGIGVSDIASIAYVDGEITALSGTLQGDINDAISDLANNYYNKTEIDNFHIDIYSTITSASGVLQDQIDALDDTYATDAELAAVSGTLQSAINDNASDISDLDAELTTASGYLQGQIDDLDAELTTASGYLQGQIDSLNLDFATDAELAAVSGTLQGAINDVASDLSTNYYTSSALDLGQLDNRYYTETEINSMLQAQDTFLELTDTISSYNAGRILFTTASGVVDASALTFDSATGLLSTTSVQLGTGGYVNEIVTTVTSGTTDNQLATAKAVWDLTEAAAAAVHTHYDVDAVYVSDTSWTYGTGFAAVPESLIVCVNGVKQRLGASYDCSVDVPGGVLTITFNYTVYNSDWVNVTYIL